MLEIKVGDLVLVRNVKKYSNYDFAGMRGEVVSIYNNLCPPNEWSLTVKFPNIWNNNSQHGVFYFEIGDIIAVSKHVDPTRHTNELHFVQEKEIKNKAVKGETKMIKIGDTVIVKNVKKYPDPEYDFTGMQGKVIKFYNDRLVCAVKFPNINNQFYFDAEDLIPIQRLTTFSNLTPQPDMCGKIFYEHTYDCMNGPAHVVNTMCEIKAVKFNPPATIIFWSDGTKTVVKAENEEFDPEKGMAMAISKKVMGNRYSYYHTFKKYLKNYENKE